MPCSILLLPLAAADWPVLALLPSLTRCLLSYLLLHSMVFQPRFHGLPCRQRQGHQDSFPSLCSLLSGPSRPGLFSPGLPWMVEGALLASWGLQHLPQVAQGGWEPWQWLDAKSGSPDSHPRPARKGGGMELAGTLARQPTSSATGSH